MTLTTEKLPVSEIMTRDLYTVEEDTPLGEVYKLFKKVKVRHLPVVRDGKLTGIISQTDLLRLCFGTNFGDDEFDVDEAIFEMLTLSQVMVNHPRTVGPEQPVEEVATLFITLEFHALPVVRGEELVGIVTTTDIIRFLLKKD